MADKKWVERRYGGQLEVLVEWDDTSEGQTHFVGLCHLRPLDRDAAILPGSRVEWGDPNGNNVWTGTVIVDESYSAELSDSEDDIPLTKLRQVLTDEPASIGSPSDFDSDPDYVPNFCSVCDEDSETKCVLCNVQFCLACYGNHTDADCQPKSAEQPVTPSVAGSDDDRDIQSAAESVDTQQQTPVSRDRDPVARMDKMAKKHPLLPPCGAACMKKCSNLISRDERGTINREFWKLNFNQQRVWIRQTVQQRDKTRIRTKMDKSRREKTTVYRLKSAAGEEKIVCKVFFLTTLGFKPNNDTMVKNSLKSGSPMKSPASDQRGRHLPWNKLQTDPIISHIESFNPAVPHYRREHAPHRRYLPTDVTITAMHADFNSKAENSISFDSYRKVVRQLKIGFVTLGQEECETCSLHETHLSCAGSNHDQGTCSNCHDHTEHLRRAQVARDLYKSDAAKDEPDSVIVSADLQKVIMLPRLPGIKRCLFTRRIIAFNETFASLGSAKRKAKGVFGTFAAVWNESIAGRSAVDVASCFWQFLLTAGSAASIIIWADNCSAQNKNWVLYTVLLTAVNCGFLSAHTVTVRYLEAGHTFMSADSFHHQVEQSLKRMKRVEDFEDFCKAVAQASSTANVLKMGVGDFRDWQDGISKHRLKNLQFRPFLKDVVEVEFRKGSNLIHVKTSFTAEFRSLSVLRKDFNVSTLPPRRQNTRGITDDRKKEIMRNLVPFLRPQARLFWTELPVSAEAEELPAEKEVNG